MTSLSCGKAGQSLDCAELTKRASIVIVGAQGADADALGECRPTCTLYFDSIGRWLYFLPLFMLENQDFTRSPCVFGLTAFLSCRRENSPRACGGTTECCCAHSCLAAETDWSAKIKQGRHCRSTQRVIIGGYSNRVRALCLVAFHATS